MMLQQAGEVLQGFGKSISLAALCVPSYMAVSTLGSAAFTEGLTRVYQYIAPQKNIDSSDLFPPTFFAVASATSALMVNIARSFSFTEASSVVIGTLVGHCASLPVVAFSPYITKGDVAKQMVTIDTALALAPLVGTLLGLATPKMIE